MKKPIKWLGGKTWLATKTSMLINQVKPKQVFEPFAGSGAFSFFHEFENVTLNDSNPALINFYSQLAKGYEINPNDFYLDKDFYELIKLRLNQSILSGVELGEIEAGYFWYLCMHSYNGLVRQNKKGLFNMPMGQYKGLATPPDTKQFLRVARNWSFNCGCFSKIDLSDANLVLIDPPYEDGKKKVFRGYTDDPNENLQARILEKISSINGVIMATNTFTPELAAIYRQHEFKVFKTMVKRSVSCKGNGRHKVPEMVAFRGLSNNQLKLLIDQFEPVWV
ncbi:Dam family site-specific DNA-(adenine-N6)-methyltransferase [Vibrio cholerae]|nr:Dam family site-specific DNA-(adenine-N6)-methyltransferase [Vibrio cholerae]